MHQHHGVREPARRRRPPTAWPGLAVATGRASAPAGRSSGSLPAPGPIAAPSTIDERLRVLGRLVAMLDGLVPAAGARPADPDAAALAALLTDDLDDHLTALMDERYEAAEDARVLEIETALGAVRERLRTAGA